NASQQLRGIFPRTRARSTEGAKSCRLRPMRWTSPLFSAVPVGLCALSCLAGCSDDTAQPAPSTKVAATYVIPSSFEQLSGKTFFDHPWPSDLRLEGGSPRLAGFYNPRNEPTLDDYIDAMKGVLDGFSPVAAGYVRFEGSIDPASLPAN